MQFHQRLTRGLISTFAARSVAIVTQLVTIPVLARAWGVDIYGQYLTMIAIAAYINIATLGVHQAAMAEMAMAYARKDFAAYGNAMRGLFQSVLVVSVLAFGAQIVLSFFLPTSMLLHQSSGGGGLHYSAPWAIFLVGVQYILSANAGVVFNSVAALGQYGEAQAYDAVRSAIDACCLWAGALLFHFGPDKTAFVSVVVWTFTIAIVWVRLGRLAPERLELLAAVDWRSFAKLWKPTVGNFAIGTMFQTVLIQSPRLILASVSGGRAVALFSIIWALMGVIRQSFEVLIHALSVEFAFAFGTHQKALATDLLALGTTTATGITAMACLPVIALGPWIISVATKGQIHAPHLMVAMLWGVLAIYSASICFVAALQSSNQSYRTFWPLVWQSAAFLVLGYLLARTAGYYGLAGALLLYQLSVTLVVIKWTTRAFDVGLKDIVKEAVSLRSFERMLKLFLRPLGTNERPAEAVDSV